MASFAPPDDRVGWLVRRRIELPAEPPARLVVDDLVLERAWWRTATLTASGAHTPPASVAEVARYGSPHGTMAVVLIAAGTSYVLVGCCVERSELDVLGKASSEA